jgi:hypothetical protein
MKKELKADLERERNMRRTTLGLPFGTYDVTAESEYKCDKSDDEAKTRDTALCTLRASSAKYHILLTSITFVLVLALAAVNFRGFSASWPVPIARDSKSALQTRTTESDEHVFQTMLQDMRRFLRRQNCFVFFSYSSSIKQLIFHANSQTSSFFPLILSQRAATQLRHPHLVSRAAIMRGQRLTA